MSPELQQQIEQCQEDVITYLDGFDQKIVDDICDIVIKNFKQNEKINIDNI